MSKRGRGTLRGPGPYRCLYSPECVEYVFCELRQEFIADSSGPLWYWWGGSQPSLSSYFFIPELLVGCPVTHPLLSLFTRVPKG
jgi:hypothetical protein